MTATLPLTVEIKANQSRTRTGLMLEIGRRYTVEPVNGLHTWTDFTTTTTIHGAASDQYGLSAPFMKMFEAWREVPTANWFRLCGEIDGTTPREIELPNFESWESGELSLFPNDVPGFYFNNSGSVTVVISALE